MKKIFIITVLLLLTGCNPKPKPYSKNIIDSSSTITNTSSNESISLTSSSLDIDSGLSNIEISSMPSSNFQSSSSKDTESFFVKV